MKNFTQIFVIAALLVSLGYSSATSQEVLAFHDTKNSVEYLDATTVRANLAAPAVNVSAIDFLRTQLKSTLVLPDFVNRYDFSGKGVFNIRIDVAGTIQDVEVIESLGSNVDRAVIKAIHKIEKVDPIVINGTQKAQVVQLPLIIK